MERLKVIGNKTLSGIINIDGSKNAALAIIPATLLCKDIVILNNIPRISDIYDMLEILSLLNVKYEFIGNTLTIDSSNIKNVPLINEHINNIRASYYFMGALLALFKNVQIVAPGGCKIGERPIDFHLEGFKKMGINASLNESIYNLEYSIMNNSTITLPFPSVGTTINLILASCKSECITVLDNISIEPEVIQVIQFLNLSGAKIKLIDEHTIVVIGKEFSNKTTFTIMQDRIEAGTYCILGALIGDNLTINNIDKQYIYSLINILNHINIHFTTTNNSITFYKSNPKNSIDVTTAPYPLFPTDLQQPLCVLASQLPNISYINEGIYYDRKSHVTELQKMGMNIKSFQNKIIVTGISVLRGAIVSAKDLRGGASLLIASLIANGTSYIENIHYIKRGYPDFINKLINVGANISLENNI